MSDEELLTITEIAGRFGTSRQTVYNKIDKLTSELKKYTVIKDNIKYIKPAGVDIIREHMKPAKKSAETTESIDIEKRIEELKSVYELRIADLKENNEYLHKTIEHLKNESIEKNNLLIERDKLLENMQVLLRDQKLLAEKTSKTWWKFWKS